MSGRRFLNDFLMLLLFVASGATTGLAFGLLSASRFAAQLDLRSESLLRSADAGIVQMASTLLTGNASIILLFLILILGLVLFAVALLLIIRRAEQRGKALVTVLIGLAIGGALAGLTLIFYSSIGRSEAAMTAAGLGGGVLARFLIWPRIVYPLLFGAIVGWAAGAVSADGMGRRVLLFLPTVLIVSGAIVVLVVVSPPMVDVPTGVPDLVTGGEGEEMTVYLLGNSEEAVPVTLDLKVFVSQNQEQLNIDRRNVSRALKVAAVMPKMHPRSAAAEHLLVAGAMAELDVEKVSSRLLKNFERRGHYDDGQLAATFIGRLAPSIEAINLLKQVTNEKHFKVGPAAATNLCKLAKIAGAQAIATKLQCPGKVSKVKLGRVKGKLNLKGRPLRRTPVGLVAAPKGLQAPWIQKGRISAAMLEVVTGGRTSAQGEMSFEHVPPGKYILAVSPKRQMDLAKSIKLASAVNIEITPQGGEIDLGEIEAGGTRPAKGSPRSLAAKRLSNGIQIDGPPAIPSIVHPGTVPPDPVPGAEGEEASPPSTALPRSAKRLVAKIQNEGANRVVVPAGFGTKLLDDDRSLFAPTASFVPVTNKTGRPIGLEIKGIRSNGIPVALGFLEGDVIQSVNGRPTRSPDDLVDLVDVLDEAKIVRVRIQREGRPKTLRIDIER